MPQPSSVLVGSATEARMRHRVILRVFALAGLSVVALTFPVVGENRFWLAGLLVALTPVPALLPRLVPADRWMFSQSVFDVSATVALIGFIPDVWAAGLVILVSSPAASSALLGRRTYMVLETAGLIGAGVAGHLSGAQNWEVPLAVALLMVPLVASYVDVVLTQEFSASTRLDDVATSSSAVFFELDARTGRILDLTELAESNEEVRRRAETDDLTGLPNRFMLVKELESRLAENRQLTLYILDLDRFKEINDTLGHGAGDDYLEVVAARLSGAADGFVARMGGDEFAVITQADGLENVIDRGYTFVRLCGDTVDIGGIDFAGSASCGIVIAPHHGDTAEDLLRRGDLAMYHAKRSGSEIHVFEFAADETNTSRLRLSGEADSALSAGQMRLWFQPKVELATGRIIGAEALLRWHHPDRGILLPADFLDVVELTKHRTALRETVVTQGIQFLARTADRAHPTTVAINISIRDLFDAEFAELLTSRLDDACVSPERLILEITERDLMDERTGFRSAADVITATGIRLSIDDFGTGHSSLLRLHQLPVTELKIDRSFVARLASDPEAELIARSIIDLGHSLGHTVVAEGIEQLAEVNNLRSLGCTVGQGYLYSPAVPEDQFLELLDASGRTPLRTRLTQTAPVAAPHGRSAGM